MGVPKFYRWLSERYPKINQRFASPPQVETCQRYFDGKLPPDPLDPPDPMALCTLPPEIDRLYLDMNGIIHGCSHNNSSQNTTTTTPAKKGEENDDNEDDLDDPANISREEIFTNVCYYLDRLVGDMVQPKQLVYMAIDGVAPRAKLNQQRSRRYRSGAEGKLETTIYQAHMLRQMQEEEEARAAEEEEIRARQEEKTKQKQQQQQGGGYFWEPSWLSNNSSNGSNGNDPDRLEQDDDDTSMLDNDPALPRGGKLLVEEIMPGRFKGKFENEAEMGSESSHHADDDADDTFHSNIITPGTPFFQDFTRHVEHFVQYKLNTDPKWKDLTIILSGPNVPGEGEHKIMQFIREQKEYASTSVESRSSLDIPDTGMEYDPNLRHCIMGQDGDLIMLGLATHEPNLVLLRERVVFSMVKRRLMAAAAALAASQSAIAKKEKENNNDDDDKNNNTTEISTGFMDAYIHNVHFEFLHMGVLRDYLAFELETSNVMADSPWDVERAVDDFVFLTFFVGNDFLPHMPALDIADHAFDLLFFTYKHCRTKWLEEAQEQGLYKPGQPHDCYLTNAGSIVSGRRLEHFLSEVGAHEVTYYDKKKRTVGKENERLRKAKKKFGGDSSDVPSDDLVQSKEASDRAAYREMLLEQQQQQQQQQSINTVNPDSINTPTTSMPVLSGQVEFHPGHDELDEGMISRMGNLLRNSLSTSGDDPSSSSDKLRMDDQDLKGRYYFDKFEFSPYDSDKHRALRKAYMEGLVWNLKYYYQGCVSWEWFYPYHYGPMLSDLVDLDDILEEITFEGKMGAPLKPFEQLLGCMPPSQSHHLPKPYRRLMTEEDSPIVDFYPKTFTVDMNGKQWPWEAVVLLPFIDSQRLLDAVASIDDSGLTDEERARNSSGSAVVMTFDPSKQPEMLPGMSNREGFRALDANKTSIVPLGQSRWNYKSNKTPVLKPQLVQGVTVPLPGYGSLRDGPVQSLWSRKLGVNVFGSRSWYKTACLELSSAMPPLPPLESLGPKLVGINVYVNYPYFMEGLVTAVSDEECTVRGHNEPKPWTEAEAEEWRIQRDGMIRRYETGEGYTGTGGLKISEDQTVTLSVRPLEGIVTAKDGSKVKTYAKFEIEVPLISTFWVPSHPDPRLDRLPARLEKNAFDIARPIHKVVSAKTNTQKSKGRKRGKLLPARAAKPRLIPEESGDSQNVELYPVPSDILLPSQPRDDPSKNSNLLELLPGSGQDKELHANAKRGFSTAIQNYEKPSDDTPGYSLQDAQAVASTATRGHAVHRRNPGSSRPSRGFSTLMSPPQMEVAGALDLRFIRRPNPQLGGSANVPRHPTPSVGKLRGGGAVRGKILAASMVVASFFFKTAGAVIETFPSLLPPTRHGDVPSHIHRSDASIIKVPVPDSEWNSAPLMDCVLQLRGGDLLDMTSEQDIRTAKAPPLEFAHGTTTLSFTFQGGIVVAVDSRASLGSFVGSKTVQKVLPINSHILGTMAGGAADCSFWIRKIKSHAMLHELTHGRRMSVARASRLLSNALYDSRGLGLSVGTMILGFDDPGDADIRDGSLSPQSEYSSPPRMFYVDDRGVRIEGDLFSVGSGSTFALSILDTERRHDMTEDEAVALGIKAIRHATFRDAYSGGFINVFVITQKDGWRKVFTEDLAGKSHPVMRDTAIKQEPPK